MNIYMEIYAKKNYIYEKSRFYYGFLDSLDNVVVGPSVALGLPLSLCSAC